jgi:hypothetical protein
VVPPGTGGPVAEDRAKLLRVRSGRPMWLRMMIATDMAGCSCEGLVVDCTLDKSALSSDEISVTARGSASMAPAQLRSIFVAIMEASCSGECRMPCLDEAGGWRAWVGQGSWPKVAKTLGYRA